MPDEPHAPSASLDEELEDLPPEVASIAAFAARLFQTRKVYSRPLELGKEYRVPGEDAATEKMGRLLAARVAHHIEKGHKQRRAVHTKLTALVEGSLRVHDRIPPELQVGLFARPAHYDLRIRYSNANFIIQPDTVGDIRGMAIQVRDVQGTLLTPENPTQDFLLITADVLAAKDAVEFLSFTRAQLNGELPKYFAPRHRRAWALLAGLSASAKPPVGETVADYKYWSAVPFRYGEGRAVKFSVRPRDRRLGRQASKKTFREALAERLQSGPVKLDLCVQPQVDPHRMPIEDATVRWSERLSKPQPVATIRLHKQTLADDMEQLGEAIRFSPWHCLAEHRPLGSLNRARRAIYQQLQAMRTT